jgi:ABC-type transport system substrate-binding protein
MISPTAAQAQGDTFGQNPVGSGPYMLESWIPGQEIHLTVNPDYSWAPPVVENQGRPDIDRLVFKIIPDPTAQVNAFQNDEVDILFINNPGHLAQLRQDENAVLLENTLNSLIYLGFNMNEPALQNLQVRQALSHAVNKQEIVDIALGGIGEVVFAPLVPTLPGFDPSLADYELGYEPQMAQQLLEEAGYVMGPGDLYTSPDGQPLTLTLLTSTRPPNEAIATVLQSQLKAVGVEVQIQQLESTAVMEAAANGEYDLLLWRYDWNDADVLNVYLGSDRIGSTNRQFYQNEQVDELLNLGAHTLDETERQQYYLQAQQLILQDAVWQPLYTPLDYTVVRSTLDNVVLGPMGRLLLNDAHWEGN